MSTSSRWLVGLALAAPLLAASQPEQAPVRVGVDAVQVVAGESLAEEAPTSAVPAPGPQGERQDETGRAEQAEAFGTLLVDTPGAAFADSNVYPPDAVGDVGPSHYVQAVSSSAGSLVRVHNKSGALQGQFTLSAKGSGGSCATGAGDPIVLYDPYVDRWWLSERASSGNTLCVYVSRTADPLGAYWRYPFTTPDAPTGPRYGVFPDAIYFSADGNAPRVYAANKGPMLTGAATTLVTVNVSALSGFTFQLLAPADADGSVPPPPGSPGIFVRHLDSELHSVSPAPPAGKDYLQLFLLQPDFATPGNSTLTGPLNIQVTDFSSSFCPSTPTSCIPQPSGTFALDPQRELVMHRLQYRNFRRHQSLVGAFAVDVGSSGVQAAVRWFELRNTGGGWTLYQEGTWAPDAAQRWIPSATMDGHGNIAAAYSVSALGGTTGNIFPGLRYSGRTVSTPLGSFDQGEPTFHAGSTSQNNAAWGAYAALSVDPADECTFWFTGQYATGSQWATQIGAFRFDVCRPFVKGDLNGDLKPDLVLRNNATGAHQVWLMNGTTRTSTGNLSHNPAATQLIAGVDDFNSDNRSDLVLMTESTGAGQFWLMNGLTRTSTVSFAGQATPWKLSATADFNRDGKADLVWRNFSTQKIQIWLMNGTGSHTNALPNPDQAVDANWEIVAALDYNGDGYVDLMWYNPVSGKIVAWFLDASYARTTGDFTVPSNAGNNNWKVLASADYGLGADGADAAPPVPGSHDLIWRNATSGKFVVWHLDYARNRTHGLFTTPDAPAAPATDWTIAGPR